MGPGAVTWSLTQSKHGSYWADESLGDETDSACSACLPWHSAQRIVWHIILQESGICDFIAHGIIFIIYI